MTGKKPPSAIDQHVGFRVRMRRMQLGLSQEALATPLGLTFQQVQKYENGKNRIGAGRLMQIALILKVEPRYFFEGAPGGAQDGGGGGEVVGPADPLTGLLATRDGVALATAFNAITSTEHRGLVVRMAELLAERKAA